MQARTRIARPQGARAGSPAVASSRRPSARRPTDSAIAGAYGHSIAAIDVMPRAPQIQRMDVAIDELSSTVRALDSSRAMSPEVQAEVENAIAQMTRTPAETPSAEELYPETPDPAEDIYEDEGE